MSSFIKKSRKYISTSSGLFTIVFGILIVCRFVYVLLPSTLWWDASVYIGMGRYIASGGVYGLWEYFRPPLLPLLFSIGGVIHMNIILWAKLLTFVSSVGSLILIYRIGERIRPYTGVYASFILGVSTLFFGFTTVPMTEVVGVFLSLYTLHLYIKKQNSFVTGLLVGFCFLLRFPYGILLPVFWIGIVVSNYHQVKKFQKILLQSIYYGLGFSLIVVPYLISNKILYGGYVLPMTVGSSMITEYLWLYSQSVWFYAKVLFLYNPLLLCGALVFFYNKKGELSMLKKAILWINVSWATLFFVYFTFQVHKEARYIVPVFPALALLSGMGLSYIRACTHRVLLYIVIGGGIILTIAHTPIYISTPDTAAGFREFYSYLSTYRGSTVITSTPVVAAYSSVKIIEAYNSWSDFYDVYMYNRTRADFVLVNSCELHVCTPGNEKACDTKKTTTLGYLSVHETIVYDKTVDSCRLIIARINK